MRIRFPKKPATAKQMGYLASLARRATYSDLEEAIEDALGVRPVGPLNREQASRVISWLLDRIDERDEDASDAAFYAPVEIDDLPF